MAIKVVRVGIIGAGANTRAKHIPGLKAIEGVEIAGVCNRTRESADRVAKEFGIPRIYDAWTALAAAPDLDAVVIGTWPYLHAPATIAALEAGKHVLCEARMAASAAEARTMFQTANRLPHLVAQVVPAPFTLSADRTIRRLLAEGFLGRILAVEVRAGGAFVDHDAPLHWRQNADLSGVNIMSLGIWYESVMRWVGEAVNVTAAGKVIVPLRKDERGLLQAVRIPDHLDVIADLACGAQAHFQISSVTGLAGPNEVFLFGSDGTLRFCEDKLFGAKHGDKQLREIPIPADERGGWRVEEKFINAIRGREPVTHTTFRDGVKYMEFTEAVHQSMAEGKTVPLPL